MVDPWNNQKMAACKNRVIIDMLKTFYIKKEFFVTTRDECIKDHYEIQEV